MKRYKYFFSIILLLCLVIGQTFCVWGAEEWYDLQEIESENEIELDLDQRAEITPYTRYIMGASISIRQPSSGVIWMRSEVYCTETMKKITTVFTLQKKVGNSWTNVGKGTVSVSNDNSMYKSMEATGASSGTYRCIADTQVTSNSGYTETVSVISGQINV